MLSYLCLLGAIIFEVSGTILLPVSEYFTKPIPTAWLTVCYLIGFFLLTFAIRSIPISIVYAIWSGLGVFFVAIFGHFVYRELLPWQGVLGLAMITSGVILVNIFSQPHDWRTEHFRENPIDAHEAFPEIDTPSLTPRSKRFFLRWSLSVKNFWDEFNH